MTAPEQPLPPDSLAARIRGEYGEMPGLRLTFAQACRLWHVEPAACHAVIETLLAEGFLRQAADGAFVALPQDAARRTPLKAALAPRAATDLSRRPA